MKMTQLYQAKKNMKKLILILLLLPFMVEAQLPTKAVREWVNQAVGAPTFSSGTKGDLSINTVNKTLYEWQGGTTGTIQSRWKQITDQATIDFYCRAAIRGEKGDKGDKGDTGATGVGTQGVQGVQGIPGQSATVLIGTTTTLPSGSGATVTNTGTATNAVLNFGIPKGADGTGGSGGGITMQQVLDMLPFIVVTPNGVDDSDNLQAAVNASFVNGKQIILGGTYKLSKGIKIQKNHKYLSITGWAELVATNQNVWAFFYSDLPASNSEAEGVYTMRRIKFSNLVLQGQNQKQSGFDLMASEGVEYSFLWGYNLNTLNTASFALRTFINYNEANGCLDGIKLISGEGRWPNATSSNSCSNGTTINSFRHYAPPNGNTAITVKYVSNTVIDYPVIEGFKVNTGIDYNSTSTTATGADIRRLHFECASPATIAVVKLRSSTMNHYIDAPAFGRPGIACFLDASSGYPNVWISRISSGRLGWDGTTKLFNNNNGNWTFSDCDDPMRSTTEIQKMFSGTPVNNGGGPNSFRIMNPINR